MASIQTASGGYRAFVYVRGVRKSKLFPTKREATAWGVRTESEILESLTKPKAQLHSLREALVKYSEDVSEFKKGKRWEQIRLKAFLVEGDLPLDKPLSDVTADDLQEFKDTRLKVVSGSTVKREFSLLSSVFAAARMDWKWGNSNPCKDVRKPKGAKHRRRVYKWWEVKRILRGLGYAPGKRVASTYQAVGASFLFALRTGMRSGEICGLPKDEVHEWHCHLADTKNGDYRDVPLSYGAKKVIATLEGWSTDDTVFGVSPGSRDAIFRKVRNKVGVTGATFHDARHTAATILARKFTMLELCTVFGWKDPKMALVYYNPSVQDLAAKLV